MQKGMPVIACTDPNTDIGKVITDGNFGWWCESNLPENFTKAADAAIEADISEHGKNAFNYLEKNYTAQKCHEIILSSYNMLI